MNCMHSKIICLGNSKFEIKFKYKKFIFLQLLFIIITIVYTIQQ